MLGVDVSKDKLCCAFVEDVTRKVLWCRDFPNTSIGVTDLFSHVSRTSRGGADDLTSNFSIVVEPTGRYSDLIVKEAQSQGRRVLLAPPKRAKSFLASLQDRAKTDPLDGRGLALYGLAASLRLFPVKSVVVEEIDQLMAARKGISGSLTRLQMQLKQLEHATFALTPAIEGLKAQKAALDKRIAVLSNENPELSAAKALQAVPGIGPVIAAAVTARLESKQFAGPDSFVAYIGLDVKVFQSGKRSGHAGLTKQGDAELRRLIYLAAQANLRSKDPNNPFKRMYERERAKGLKTTAALCSVARKIAKLCWSLHRNKAQYNPERVLMPPIRVSKPEVTTPIEDNSDGYFTVH